jgi:hypothetical protein
MARRHLSHLLLGAVLVGAGSCGPGVDLTQALAVTDVQTGWYDNGPRAGGSHVVPSITFRLTNESDRPITSVQLAVQFWRDGDDGMWDEALVTGIGPEALEPGASTEPILVRLGVGYNQPGPLADIFDNREFRDATARIFGRRSGRIMPLDEFRIDQRIIPHFTDPGRP